MEALADVLRVWYVASGFFGFALLFQLVHFTPKHYPMPWSRKAGLTSVGLYLLAGGLGAWQHWGDPFVWGQIPFSLGNAVAIASLFGVMNDREDFFKNVRGVIGDTDGRMAVADSRPAANRVWRRSRATRR